MAGNRTRAPQALRRALPIVSVVGLVGALVLRGGVPPSGAGGPGRSAACGSRHRGLKFVTRPATFGPPP